jgi:hypothetical protein
MMKLQFQPIPDYNLQVATSGDNQSRILLFTSNDLSGAWERVDGAQIIIAGAEAKKELWRFVKNHGRPSASELIPGGIAGRAYPALRKYFGLSK